ncbi:NUDIX hydrolase [Candidatus Saccharibacteria bacterium]|nr:NUDIX hydrolase [Candidatus Saccharibacteria bacterium]
MKNDNPFKTISTKVVYQNPWITVEENEIIHPDTGGGIYGVVITKDSVTVVPVNNKGEIFLIRSFSYPAQKWHWELPAGGVGDDDFITASKRELFEETGIKAKTWQKIGVARPMDGLMPERMAALLATDLVIGEIPKADDNHLISDRRFFDLPTVREMVRKGKIDEGQSLSALYYYELYLQKEEK